MSQRYRPEWLALEHFCRAFSGADGRDEAVALAADPSFAWGTLLEQAVLHKLHPLVAMYAATTALAPRVAKGFGGLLRDVRAVNRRRLEVYLAEALRIVGEARRRSVPVISRKGLGLELTVYGAQGVRAFDDLDFMIQPEHGPAVTRMMRDLGYEGGKVDPLRNRIVPHDRRKVVTYRVAPDHLPPFARPVDDPLVGHVEVDFAMSLTWWGSEFDIPLAEPFARITHVRPPSGDGALPVFSPEYQVIDGAMHLFREAFVEMPFQASGNAVKLRSFLDVRLLLERQANAAGLPRLLDAISSAGIQRPVAWVLTHLDQVFGTKTLAALGLDGVVPADWAASWRRMGGELARWHGDMRRRLASGGGVGCSEAAR